MKRSKRRNERIKGVYGLVVENNSIFYTIFDFISPTPTGDGGQDSTEGFLVGVRQTGRLDEITPLHLFFQVDEGDVVSHLSRNVIGMHYDSIDGNHPRLLRLGILQTVLGQRDLELRRPSTVWPQSKTQKEKEKRKKKTVERIDFMNSLLLMSLHEEVH